MGINKHKEYEPRTMKRGQKFIASSFRMEGKVWKISRRVKNQDQNTIWTVCPSTGQKRKYTNRSWHHLLDEGIITLVRKGK